MILNKLFIILVFAFLYETCSANFVGNSNKLSNSHFAEDNNFCPVLNGGLISIKITAVYEGQTPGKIVNDMAPAGGAGNPIYQWLMSVDGINYIAIAGADSLEYTVPVLFQSTWFCRQVIDGTTEYSNSVYIAVDFALDGGITIINNLHDGSGLRVLSVKSNINKRNGKCEFQWQKSDAGQTYNDIYGANDSLLTVTEPAKNEWYRRYVKQNGKKEYSIAAVVGPGGDPLNAGTISFSNLSSSLSKTINSGDNVGYIYSFITPSGGSGGYTFQWKQSNDNLIWTDASSSPGYPSTNLNYVGMAPLYTNTTFRLYVTDSESGISTYSNNVSVNISTNPQLSPGSIAINNSSSISIAPGNFPGTIYGTLPSGGTGTYSYMWQESTDNGSSWHYPPSSYTGQDYTPGAISVKTIYKRIVTSGSLTAQSNTVTVEMISQGGGNVWQINGNKIYYSVTNGMVGIGTSQPDKMLTVNGIIHSKGVLVESSVPAPDYVFEKGYKLTEIESLNKFIQQNKHLPGVPSASEMATKGVDLYDMNMILLKKIEELTLYILQLNLKIDEQTAKMQSGKVFPAE